MQKISFLLLVAVLRASQGVRWRAGPCPDLEDLPRFLPGQNLMQTYWYQRKSMNNFLFSEEGKCTTLYNAIEHGGFATKYQQINEKNLTELTYGVASTVGYRNFMEKKIFKYQFFGEKFQPIIDLPFIIIATDQVNYAVIYTCKQDTDPDSQKTKKLEGVWVHTAVRGDTKYDEKIKRHLEVVGLDYDSFKETDQDNCPDT